MRSKKILALRYSTTTVSPVGKISYHIITGKDYNIGQLRSQARNGVKRGLEQFTISKITFERLASEGWRLQEDTLARQNRLKSMTRQEWELLCRSASDLPGFSVFAAMKGEILASALIVCRINNVYTVPYSMSRSLYLSAHVNNALFFTASVEMLKEPGVDSLFFTVQSLDAPPDVDEFKLRMGLKSKMTRQVVAFHPYLNPFVGPSTHKILSLFTRRFPSSPYLAKTEGMIRFCVEGKLPVARQTLPDCFSDIINIDERIRYEAI